jgi:hypothetical protein
LAARLLSFSSKQQRGQATKQQTSETAEENRDMPGGRMTARLISFLLGAVITAPLFAMPTDRAMNDLLVGLASKDANKRKTAEAAFEKLELKEKAFITSTVLGMCAQESKDCPRPPDAFFASWMNRLATEGTTAIKGDKGQRLQGVQSLETVAAVLNEASAAEGPVVKRLLSAYQGPSLEKISSLLAGHVADADAQVRDGSITALQDLGPAAAEGALPVLNKLMKSGRLELRPEVVQLVQALEPSLLTDPLQSLRNEPIGQ